MKNERLLNVRVKAEVIDELNIISNHLDLPYSQIVREAIRTKIDQLKKKHPDLAETLNKPLALNN